MVASFFVRYAAWHFTQAPSLLFQLWMNLLWYLGHVFSVNELGRSLFSPWKRIVAQHTKRWDFEDYASAALANFISRIIGAVMRLILIVIGRSLQLLLIVFGGLFYMSWFVLPIIVVLMALFGLGLII